MKSFLINLSLFFPALLSAQLFVNASANLPATASGANMDLQAADLDSDDDLDLVFAREFQPNFILKNNGAGVFTNGSSGNLPQETHDSEDVAIADFNNDGNLDLVFCSEDDVNQGWSDVHEFYLGDGTGKFTVAGYQPPDSEANAVVAEDVNSDGFPDLVFGGRGTLNVLINNGLGSFAQENDRVPGIARVTQDLIFFDADGDTDRDLMTGNENGNLLFINDGTGHFADESDARLPFLAGLNLETRKIAVGDADGDEDLDVFLANVAFINGKDPQNRLFLNDGTGHFSDATATNLPFDEDHTIDAIFEDLDLDEDLDLVVANVFGAPIKIYGNNGAGLFADSTMAILGQFYTRDALGVIAADLNGDGLRDLYFCHRRTPSNPQKDLLLLRTGLSATGDLTGRNAAPRVYPNPVEDHFFIKSDLNLDSARLENASGQTLMALRPKPFGAGIFRCGFSNGRPKSGTYFLRCFSGERELPAVKIFVR